MRTYTICLSTASTINPPVQKNSNLTQVTWRVNWREIFGNRTGEARVRCKFYSQAAAYTTTSTFGTIRLNLATNGSQLSNGLALGILSLQNDFATSGSGTTSLICDTSTFYGQSFIIPNTNSELTVSLINGADAFLSTTIQPYILMLYFDIDENEPTLSMDEPKFNLAR